MTEWQPPQPERPVYIVGDIHGCADKLSHLLRAIDEDISRTAEEDPDIVFIGDYVDRGEESREVISFLYDLDQDFADRVTCLAGNHEAMMLSFIEDPLGRAKHWLRYGGMQTLASYGINPPKSLETPTLADLLDAAGDLRDAIGDRHLQWLQRLPKRWSSGNLWAVHAGADPSRPMDKQDDRTLLWGHDDFFRVQRTDRQWVAVGHTVVKRPAAEHGRITTDTGAVFGQRMTAARVTPDGEVSFLSQ